MRLLSTHRLQTKPAAMEISQRKRRGMGGGDCRKRRRGSKRESRRDRISELPDEIQRHILSFLTTKAAVQTSVLSKQWRRTWAGSPILTFDRREFASVADFVSFADRAVVLHGGSSLARLELSWHDGFDMLKAEMWFKYAMRRNVEELWLDIPAGRSRPLPSFLFYGCAKIHFYSSTVV